MPTKPSTLPELFQFYHDYVKLLYSSVQVENHLPIEVLFELNAALDHLSRHWVYDETEQHVVEKAYSHFKRSCLDIFKLKLKQTMDQYAELKGIDTSIIDNGRFEGAMRDLAYEIKNDAISARRIEGMIKDTPGNSIFAFDLWEPVFNKCIIFEKDFYRNPNLDWARSKVKLYTRKQAILSVKTQIILSILGSFIAGAVLSNLSSICHWLSNFFSSAKP